MKKPIQITLTAAILLFTLIFASQAKAQNVTIPDANFKAALVANASINTNADTEISVVEANAYTGTIDVSGLTISNLTGIEAFTSITSLDCSTNSITNLNLGNNTALTSVDCSNNNLTILNLFGLTALTNLFCGNNSLTCLDLHTNVSLTVLDCGPNNLTSLNLKNGNNAFMSSANLLGAGSMLFCVQVDDASAVTASPFFIEDTWVTYNNACGTPMSTSFINNSPVCFGSPVTFTDASTGTVNFWNWDFGDGTTANNATAIHTYNGGGNYWVTLISGNCNRSDTFAVNVQQGNDISGNVSYSLGNVTNGTAILMPYNGTSQMLDTLYTSTLSGSGSYSFPHVIDGNYIIKVFPDTTIYPNLTPTYFISDWLWDSSTVHVQPCNLPTTANILMVELVSGAPGTGSASGLVIQGSGFGRAQGDPIHGVDVKLGITGSNNIVADTETDLSGQYIFNNLANGNYTVYVDIPGLMRDSVYSFTIDATNQDFNDLHYWVDSTSIYIAPGIGIENIDDPNLKSLMIYPNPVNDISNIRFTLVNNEDVKLELQNIYGVKLQTLAQGNMEEGEHVYKLDVNNLPMGTYFITLTVNGKARTIRTVVMK